jgi:phage terminase Nu1 subunit (DNA packaging protein)
MTPLLLDGLIDRKELARQSRRTERTVSRWIADGLPVKLRVGNEPYIDPADARRWFENGGATSQRLRPQPRRGRRGA